MTLPAAAACWIRTHRGEPLEWCRLGGTSSSVWRVDTPGGPVVVKVHRSDRARRQELAALDIAPVAVPRPTVLATVEDAIVLEWLEMTPLLAPADHLRERGAVLRALHDMPLQDSDPMSLADALRTRADALSARAETRSERDAAESLRLQTNGLLGAGRRVLAHRDPRRDNWGMAEVGLALIDFEHARLDARATDFAVLWADGAFDDAGAMDTFAAGYGVRPDADPLWRVATGLQALAAVCWSRAHGDVARLRDGQQRLQQWLAALRDSAG